ncbi:MAG: NYN domain-containing protein [Verrucomicrobiae bacterium]|nr:NYN domain-containing protein [Verrucomicrobiae bacterium]
MALVRILVDGYSLLHRWPELAPGRPRHSAAARDALIARLQQYRDAIHTPITIVFDGQGAPPGTTRPVSTTELEILYSPAGRTADDLIERAAVRLKPYGEVLVVTDDFAERDTVSAFGGLVSSCRGFIGQVEDLLRESGEDLRRWNRGERDRFRRGR